MPKGVNMGKTDKDDRIGAKELGQILEYAEPTIRLRWREICKRLKIRAYRIGQRVTYSRSDAIAAVENSEIKL